MLWILSIDLGLHVSEARQIYSTGTNMVLDAYYTILTQSMSIVNQSCVDIRVSLSIRSPLSKRQDCLKQCFDLTDNYKPMALP